MAVEASQPLKISLPASAALAQQAYNEDQAIAGFVPTQFTFVKVNAAGAADIVAANTDIPIGVLQNRPVVLAQAGAQLGGVQCEIVIIGVTKLVAGGTITLAASTPGNLLKMSVAANHVGTALQATAGTGGTLTIVGQSLVAAASGDIFKALVDCAAAASVGT